MAFFSRGAYEAPLNRELVKTIELPWSRRKGYSSRIGSWLEAIRKLRLEVRNAPASTVIYAFGLDCCVVGLVVSAGRYPVVWEVSDLIVPYLRSGGARWLATRLEKLCLRNVAGVVTVTQAMFSEYLIPLAGGRKIPHCTIENRLDSRFLNGFRAREREPGSALRIGWTGARRNLDLHTPILRAIAHLGSENAVLVADGAGEGTEILSELVQSYDNFIVRGPYKESPNELQSIYSELDIQVILDPPNNQNVALTLPNRLFHCLAFNTPVIVTVGSASAHIVEKLGIGCAVNPHTVDWGELLLSLKSDGRVEEWRESLRKLPLDARVRDDSQLVTLLHQIALQHSADK